MHQTKKAQGASAMMMTMILAVEMRMLPGIAEVEISLRIISLLIFVALLAGSVTAQEPALVPRTEQLDSKTLLVGREVERPLAGGETHSFNLNLSEGQFVEVRVDQRGIDVLLRLYSPENKRIAEIDSPNSSQGRETVFALADRDGSYRLEVTSLSKDVPSGRYAIEMATLRPANAQDKQRLEAQSAYIEAQQFRAQNNAGAQRNAIQRLESVLPLWRATDEKLREAHTLSLIASTQRRLGEQNKALEYWNQALQLVRTLGDKREEATTLNNIAIVLGDTGEPARAVESYLGVIALWRQVGDRYAEARVQNNLGLAYNAQGEPRKALEYLNQSLAVWQQVGNVRQSAATIQNICGVYEVLGDMQQALTGYEKALNSFSMLKDSPKQAGVLNSIGFIYDLLGETSKALNYYDQSLKLWHLVGDRQREAITLTNIGIAHAKLGSGDKALEQYNSALKIQREVGDRRWEAFTLEKLGDLYASQSELQKASASYEQALQLRKALGDRWGEANVLNSTGIVQTKLTAPDKAFEFHKQALNLYEAIGDKRGQARAIYGIARAERDRGNLDEARKQIELAIAKVEAARSDVSSQNLRTTYLATVENYYEFYIDLLMRFHKARPAEGFDGLALALSERARARSLLDRLVESHVEIQQGVDQALLEKQRLLAEQLNAKAQRRVQLFSKKGGDAQLTALNNELNDLESQYDQVQAAIRKASPQYAALTQPQPLGLKEIQKQLDTGTVLLEYSLGDERSYVWVVTQDSLRTLELPKRGEIEPVAKRLYQTLTARSVVKRLETPAQRQRRISAADVEMSEVNAELSRMILLPIADELGTTRVVVVASGALQYVPFAALSVRGRPLILDHVVVNLPSASALAVQRTGLAGRKLAPRAVAVIADPVFSAADPRMKSAVAAVAKQPSSTAETRIIEHVADKSTGGLNIRRLPFTRQEAEQILSVAPRGGNLKALDFKADRAIATGGELSNYRYVHFATHGYVDSERADYSAVVLSMVNEAGEPKDGFLRVHDIYNLKLPAELVVLSACETGLGREYKGEGLVGLTQGFMYAGARRVTVSLWNVNDQATADLMARFYRGMLREKKSPADALRTAQIEMMRLTKWRSPYFWAPFVMQGEWR
jgi:CHAT domain-containing protein/Tfp pilus assembly protein PilF